MLSLRNPARRSEGSQLNMDQSYLKGLNNA
jgi:hypothetical protein